MLPSSKLLLCVLLAIVTSDAALALADDRYLSEAKVSLVQARQLALKTYRRQIVSEELEKESAG